MPQELVKNVDPLLYGTSFHLVELMSFLRITVRLYILYGLSVCPLPKSHAEILRLDVMLLGGEK